MMSVERMTEVMQECDKYELRLANDPTILGPKYLQDMIATCRNYTNHVARLLNEVARVKMDIGRDLRRKQTAFKIAADELLAKNIVVRNLPNIKDRESQINLMLKDEHREIVTLENDILDITHVEDYVKRRHRELKDTMREIQSQRNLLRDEHATGSMYGDERPTSMGGESLEDAYTPGAHAKPDGIDEGEIERLLNEANASPAEEAPQTVDSPTTEPVTTTEPSPVAEARPQIVAPKPESDEDLIKAFLYAPDTQSDLQVQAPSKTTPEVPKGPSVVADNDFSDFLNTL